MPKLRGHHLLCLHFFKGEGYDKNFVDNLRKVLERTGIEEVDIVEGGDEVCRACSYFKDNLCHYNNRPNEYEIKALDTLALELLNLKAGERISWSEIKSRLPEVFRNWKEGACFECHWLEVCKSTELWRELNEG